MNTQNRKLTWKNYLAYGAADLYGGGCFFIVTTFSMYYLVNVVGLHPLLAGLIPAIGKFWDAVSDPLMGYIADNTPQNRFGKRRVWFLISIVPIALSFMHIWFPAHFESQAGKFIFYTIAYIAFFTVSTVSYIPYAALSAEMTESFSERNKLNTSRLMFSFIATLLGGVLAQPIIDSFHGSKMGYFVMSCVFALIFALPWIPLYFGTWEKASVQEKNAKGESFMRNFLSLFKNKSCRIHIAMYVCSYGALDIFMSFVLFYMVDYLDRGSVFVIIQGTLLITMMLVLPVHNHFINKFGHRPVYITALVVFALSVLLMLFHTPTSPVVLLILNMVLMGIGISANNLIPHQLLPFISDIDKLMSGKSRAGTYSAAMTLTRKLFLGLVIMTSIGAILNGIGYKNPVPSILTENQFTEARELSVKHGQDFSAIEAYYAKGEDGNLHLKYLPRSADSIVSDAYTAAKKHKGSAGQTALKAADFEDAADFFEEKKSSAEIPAGLFENLILGSLNPKNFRDADLLFFLKSAYKKSGDFYVYIEPQDFYSKADLYDLKVLLEKIEYPYSGIGEVQKPLQKNTTLHGVRLAFVLMPLAMIILGIVIGLTFKVTPLNHKIVLEELKRLEEGGKKEDAPENTKAVCELLTGLPYGR
ncbi:MFS transporter [Treponema sp. OMZ 840]|uniref:MFS transporter n=1 Tax=Treponema sp. OMZ 840 TaxID=244313 RepID=UPI003D8F1AE5